MHEIVFVFVALEVYQGGKSVTLFAFVSVSVSSGG